MTAANHSGDGDTGGDGDHGGGHGCEPGGKGSDAERARLAALRDGEPLVEFAGGSTPYIDYQSIDVLLSLQQPRSDAPAELPFYVLGQVKELLFKLLYEELVRVRSLLAEDEVWQATWVLRRVQREAGLLCSTWDVLGSLAPTEFNAFRDSLGQASGLQSYMYRMVEYVLGNKDPRLARPHLGVPGVAEQVRRALEEPSVYDAALALLARRGAPLPATALERDWSQPYAPSDAAERAWAQVYAKGGAPGGGPSRPESGGELFWLAEALADVAEAMCRWRSLHLLTVERIIGTKPGTGGTHGVAWLRRVSEHRFFPDLWAARGRL